MCGVDYSFVVSFAYIPVRELVKLGNSFDSTPNRHMSEAWKCSTFNFAAAIVWSKFSTRGMGKKRRPVSIMRPRHCVCVCVCARAPVCLCVFMCVKWASECVID